MPIEPATTSAGLPEDVLKYVLDRQDRQIDTEMNLVSARMTWLVISQSFLFGAFIGSGALVPPVFGESVQALVSLVGLLSSAWVRTGVAAALAVVDRRKDERRPILASLSQTLGVELPAVHRDDPAHSAGNAPPQRIPAMLILAWATLMLLWTAKIVLVP
jgi:hypothetical protein